MHRLVIEADFTLIGLDKTRENLHQGAFAGAVFTQNPLNRAGRDDKGDVIVGMHRAKMFLDLGEFDFHNLF